MEIFIEIIIYTAILTFLLYLLLLILIRRAVRERRESGWRYTSSIGMREPGSSDVLGDKDRAEPRSGEDRPGYVGIDMNVGNGSDGRRKIIYLSERRKRMGK